MIISKDLNFLKFTKNGLKVSLTAFYVYELAFILQDLIKTWKYVVLMVKIDIAVVNELHFPGFGFIGRSRFQMLLALFYIWKKILTYEANILRIINLDWYVDRCNFDTLLDLVSFDRFKKREKHPWRSVIFSNVANLLKVTLFHGCFSHFLNCTNGT